MIIKRKNSRDDEGRAMSYGLELGVVDGGSLQLYEYYAGKYLVDMYGDSDLEFYYTVNKKDIPKLLKALLPNEDYNALKQRERTAKKALSIIKKKFHDKDQIVGFFDDNNITYDSYSH